MASFALSLLVATRRASVTPQLLRPPSPPSYTRSLSLARSLGDRSDPARPKESAVAGGSDPRPFVLASLGPSNLARSDLSLVRRSGHPLISRPPSLAVLIVYPPPPDRSIIVVYGGGAIARTIFRPKLGPGLSEEAIASPRCSPRLRL
jgi:hypothetical protein